MTFFLHSHLGLSRIFRSNDDRCWILRLQLQNFAAIFHFALLTRVDMKYSKVKWIRTLEPNLSYIGLPYLFEVRAKLSGTIATFRGPSLKIQHWSSFDLNDLKRSKWECKKKLSWYKPVSPIDARNSICYKVIFNF